MKAYNLPLEYVLYEMSYTNMIMYGSVLPGYGSSRQEHGADGVIRADNPGNRSAVRNMMFE
ncbi:MAG: hypothetical protein LBV26_09395 [Bacteroidales bacterium]|nr:hypothetical protein [Bacteroidales bacterium]